MDFAPRVAVLVGLDPQQLLLVVPLVQRTALVETLVALEPDQPGTGHLGDRLGELRLAGAGGTLDQDRLAEPVGEERHSGDSVVGQVVDALQAISHLLDTVEAVRNLCCHGDQRYNRS